MRKTAPVDEMTLCCLLWAVPGQERAMTAYEDEVLAMLPDHGMRVVQRVVGDGSGGNPHEVQIYSAPGQPAIDAYVNDPRRLALAATRDRVVARTELFGVAPR